MKKIIVMVLVAIMAMLLCSCDMSNPLNIHDKTTVTTYTANTSKDGNHFTLETHTEKYFDGELIYKD